jgi:hypothetical protein
LATALNAHHGIAVVFARLRCERETGRLAVDLAETPACAYRVTCWAPRFVRQQPPVTRAEVLPARSERLAWDSSVATAPSNGSACWWTSEWAQRPPSRADHLGLCWAVPLSCLAPSHWMILRTTDDLVPAKLGSPLGSLTAFLIVDHGASQHSPLCGPIALLAGNEFDCVKAISRLPLNCCRNCIRVAALQWLRLAKQARFVSLRDDCQGNRPDLTDAGRTTAVYGKFVRQEKRWEAVKAVRRFDCHGIRAASSLAPIPELPRSTWAGRGPSLHGTGVTTWRSCF